MPRHTTMPTTMFNKKGEDMTRRDLYEAMARAAANQDEDQRQKGGWDALTVGEQMKWVQHQAAGVWQLEILIPGIRQLLPEADWR